MFKNLAKELREFILRGNVLDMAVGIIIGASFKSIVDSMVNDIIMPPIGMLLGKVDFSNLYLQISPALTPETTYPSLEAAKAAGAVTLNYGMFINTGLNSSLFELDCSGWNVDNVKYISNSVLE